ncbi:MAG: glutathione S-transferase family protein [Rhodobacteraceae bacterium]|nr:glutathione S-transferase family protein [Paracoccaceae bacterium]MCY4198124.1 glutathione S-transferase family protein [Paracoccaceae bacterium]
MKLYDYVLSGNCYKVRLLLHFLDIKCTLEPVDFYPGRAHKSPSFRRINPLEQLPVLELDDGKTRICDSQAILIYLAHKFDPSRHWFPVNEPEKLGCVVQWLTFANCITAASSRARLHDMLGYTCDITAARAHAHRAFRHLEDHLCHQEFNGINWLAGAQPTLADVACFPYTCLAGDGGIDIFIYPAIQRWLRRFATLPRFHPMPGINIR